MTATVERAGPPTLHAILDRIAAVGTTEHWVVSCYLKLEPRDRSRGKYTIKLKNHIKERLAWLDKMSVSRAEREIVGRDLDRVREYLDTWLRRRRAGRRVSKAAAGGEVL